MAFARTVLLPAIFALNIFPLCAQDMPVAGLSKRDFVVFEDGKPQAIDFFEQHSDPTFSQRPASKAQSQSIPEGKVKLDVVVNDSAGKQCWDWSPGDSRFSTARFASASRFCLAQSLSASTAFIGGSAFGSAGATTFHLRSVIQIGRAHV